MQFAYKSIRRIAQYIKTEKEEDNDDDDDDEGNVMKLQLENCAK